MRPFALFFFAAASLVWSCGPGGTYCQSGAKMGTECHMLSDARNPPGSRPIPPPETNFWNQAPPNQGTFGGSSIAGPSSGPVPMSSPAWRPTPPAARDAGADAAGAI
jgi:hypothetical protein